MGNSNGSKAASDPLSNVDPFVQIIEYGYNVLKSANEHVSQDQFERLFSCFSSSQSSALWSKLFPGTTAVDLHTYAESVRSLESVRNDADRIRFILSMIDENRAGGDNQEIPYIHEFLQWCAAVNSFDEDEVTKLAGIIAPNFLPLDEGKLPSVDSFARWCVRHCPEIAHDFCTCVTESLRKGRLLLPLNGKLKESLRSSTFNPSTMWLLSNCVGEVYKYNRLKDAGRVLDKFNSEKMCHMHRLFDSDEHGLSSSRMKYLVFDYEAPTLTFIEFPEQSYCLALDSPYKEEWTTYGGPYTALYSVEPKFYRVLGGENLVYCNFSTKTGKRCIAVGRNPINAPIIECDEGICTGSVYGMSKKLVRFEVWGCGGDAQTLLQKQADIREWERKEAARQRDRKIKGEAWEDSPDRAIMSWGGVNAKHSEMIAAQPDEDQEEKDE